MEKVRIDKWLWAVRIFKTRSLAAEECGKGHVSIGDAHVKASREVKVGDVVKVRVPPIEREYVVKQITDKRMSAQLAVDFVEEITPQEKLDILRGTFMQFESRVVFGTSHETGSEVVDKLKDYKILDYDFRF